MGFFTGLLCCLLKYFINFFFFSLKSFDFDASEFGSRLHSPWRARRFRPWWISSQPSGGHSSVTSASKCSLRHPRKDGHPPAHMLLTCPCTPYGWSNLWWQQAGWACSPLFCPKMLISFFPLKLLLVSDLCVQLHTGFSHSSTGCVESTVTCYNVSKRNTMVL